MLVSRLGRRVTITPWTSSQRCRHFSDGKEGPRHGKNSNGQVSGRGRTRPAHTGDWGLKNNADNVSYTPHAHTSPTGPSSDATQTSLGNQSPSNIQQTAKEPSLVEQLFPSETKQLGEAQKKARELPPMPLSERALYRPKPQKPIKHDDPDTSGIYRSPEAWRLYRMREQEMKLNGKQPTILLLRNASTNLTEDDFRRVTPQGKHLEGWTVEQSTFTKIVPGRDLATLEQQNYYYLLFAHQMAAFIYQGHVSRLAALAMHYTPSSVTSPAAPPPGYRLNDGTDLYAALQSYTLGPPSQNLDLRQLRPPLSPLLQAIIDHQGYPGFVDRPDKSPYEVRLTLDGPQLKVSIIEFILHESALARSLGWSGGTSRIPRVTVWQPQFAPSPTDKKPYSRAAAWAQRYQNEATEEVDSQSDVENQQPTALEAEASNMESENDNEQNEDEDDYDEKIDQRKHRLPRRVYIVGFQTEHAAQAFVRYWHRRPMFWEGSKASAGARPGGDIPPIANAELLW